MGGYKNEKTGQTYPLQKRKSILFFCRQDRMGMLPFPLFMRVYDREVDKWTLRGT